MSIHVYKKGRSHIVDDLDCTIVSVNSNEERLSLLAQGDHFDTVQEIYAPKKEKKPKTAKGGEIELAKNDAPELEADENENTAD